MNPEEQAKKSLLIKVGIIVIVAVILFLWLANLRGVFESQRSDSDSDISWKEINNEINQSFKETEDRFNDANSPSENSFVKDLLDKASTTATSTVSSSEEFKKNLLDLNRTGTITPKRTDCPEYINCMPSIGEPRPCVIPTGCEGITQKAY